MGIGTHAVEFRKEAGFVTKMTGCSVGRVVGRPPVPNLLCGMSTSDLNKPVPQKK